MDDGYNLLIRSLEQAIFLKIIGIATGVNKKVSGVFKDEEKNSWIIYLIKSEFQMLEEEDENKKIHKGVMREEECCEKSFSNNDF